MPAGAQVLNNTRIKGVMQGLLDARTLPQNLLFSQRVREVPADDGEIMGRFIGLIHVADLVADDQRAGVYSSGKFQFEQYNIPNLKIGQAMSQSMFNQWLSINGNPGVPGYVKDLFSGNENRILLNLRIGVAQRKETLIAGMMMDSFSYNRLGIIMTGATWGMPSDLKVTVSDWTNTGTGTPVGDLQNMMLTASVRYNIVFNRLTLGTTLFRYMIATTEFQNKARMYLAPNVSFVNLSTTDLAMMRTLAQNVLGLEIVLYDTRVWQQQTNGIWVQSPVLDLDAFILDNSANDGDVTVQDWANGIVTESVVSSLTGDGVIPGGPQFGPIGYSIPNPSYNPPGIDYWAVQRGFPRKHLLQANACGRVNAVITETISTAAPF